MNCRHVYLSPFCSLLTFPFSIDQVLRFVSFIVMSFYQIYSKWRMHLHPSILFYYQALLYSLSCSLYKEYKSLKKIHSSYINIIWGSSHVNFLDSIFFSYVVVQLLSRRIPSVLHLVTEFLLNFRLNSGLDLCLL